MSPLRRRVPLGDLVVVVCFIALLFLLVLLAFGCASRPPRIVTEERRVFTAQGSLQSEVKRATIESPARVETAPLVETSRDGIKVTGAKGDNQPSAAAIRAGRDWVWTLVCGIPAIGLIVFGAWQFYRNGWKTVSLYPIGIGIGLIAFTMSFQSFPLLWTIVLVGGLCVVAVGLFLHFNFTWNKAVASVKN
jgi:hypothetical protein